MTLSAPQAIIFDINGVLLKTDKQAGLRSFLQEKAASDDRINLAWQGDVIALLNGLLYKHCPLCAFGPCKVVSAQAKSPHIKLAVESGELNYEGMKVGITRMLTHHVHCPPAAQITLDYVTEFITQPPLMTRNTELIQTGVALLRHVHKTHGAHNLYILSNMPVEIFNLHKNRFSDVFELVPEGNVMLSSQTGKRKPAADAFAQVGPRYNLLPKNCLFFDDKTANVQAARDAGMAAATFTPQGSDELAQWYDVLGFKK